MIANIEVKPKTTGALLRLVNDNKLSFKQHVDVLCQKAS